MTLDAGHNCHRAESGAEAALQIVEVGYPEYARKSEKDARELDLAAHQPEAEVRRVAINDGEGAVSASDGLRDAGRGHERQSEGVICRGLGNHDELAL
ncbi:uncharacterized protein MONOS_4885 [Monocercomonoides exilis]|uniref:uncharacterized protein n=1 Tax=Monocercomonoides exilis TaxID=2049356 RepID=UPI00355A4A3F|nr:hypothetical protein MONOS_4885 [Monocercomonoides exilis]|eukprot:MONOS_4885.1-p1 / transcript=MONOS_4885.1 / gene=MONOS_4885 / organism=Monocercomonoides_exilis_PA203 / gene_product=unspecified product / transcript_product=unspecified product / location=Mono_scaffold00136:61626-61919(+) / protein_length=98 / sequence_SO=supercontig / SO=protein_coding / is_pseudo=false